MYSTVKNQSPFVQARDRYLTGAENRTLDFGQLLRDIRETEKAMREINGSASEPFQEERLFYTRHNRCSICRRLGDDAAYIPTRGQLLNQVLVKEDGTIRNPQRAYVTLRQYTHNDKENMGADVTALFRMSLISSNIKSSRTVGPSSRNVGLALLKRTRRYMPTTLALKRLFNRVPSCNSI